MGTRSDSAAPVPVVRLIVANARGEALVLKRADTAYAEGRWCLPGGKVDYGETVEEAAVRELREETRLDCVSARLLFYQDSLPPEPGSMHCINFYFECAVEGDLETDPESSDWAWVGPDDLDRYDLAFRNDEGLRVYWQSNR